MLAEACRGDVESFCKDKPEGEVGGSMFFEDFKLLEVTVDGGESYCKDKPEGEVGGWISALLLVGGWSHGGWCGELLSEAGLNVGGGRCWCARCHARFTRRCQSEL